MSIPEEWLRLHPHRLLGLLLFGLFFVSITAGTQAQEPVPEGKATVDSGEATAIPAPSNLFLPQGELFEPLLADLQWPRFSAEYQWRFGTDEFDRLAAVSFGESFALVRSPEQPWGRWEIGMQAKVDAIFDMTTQSFDLSNENYFVAVTGAVEVGGITTQLRISHTSSHLGDEYLLETGSTRESVSYETIDVLASYPIGRGLRVYGGGGVYASARPDFDPVLTQLGFEWVAPISLASGWLHPVLATDLHLRQENDWIPEVAVLAALRLAHPLDDLRHLEFYLRFYHGRSPEGQFYRQTIDSLGIGLRFGF